MSSVLRLAIRAYATSVPMASRAVSMSQPVKAIKSAGMIQSFNAYEASVYLQASHSLRAKRPMKVSKATKQVKTPGSMHA